MQYEFWAWQSKWRIRLLRPTWHFPICRGDSILHCSIIKHAGGELREGRVHTVLYHQSGDTEGGWWFRYFQFPFCYAPPTWLASPQDRSAAQTSSETVQHCRWGTPYCHSNAQKSGSYQHYTSSLSFQWSLFFPPSKLFVLFSLHLDSPPPLPPFSHPSLSPPHLKSFLPSPPFLHCTHTHSLCCLFVHDDRS